MCKGPEVKKSWFEDPKASQGGQDKIVKGIEGCEKEFRFYSEFSGKCLKDF